jgi:hypothetical protein
VDIAGRRTALLSLLQEPGRVDVGEAAVRFGTVEMTIPRDLEVLVAQGAARRVRGAPSACCCAPRNHRSACGQVDQTQDPHSPQVGHRAGTDDGIEGVHELGAGQVDLCG